MKKLNDLLKYKSINEVEESVDFEEYLDVVINTVELLHQTINKFNEAAGSIPENDLGNKESAIKDFIDSLQEKLDELDEIKNTLNRQHGVNILK